MDSILEKIATKDDLLSFTSGLKKDILEYKKKVILYSFISTVTQIASLCIILELFAKK